MGCVTPHGQGVERLVQAVLAAAECSVEPWDPEGGGEALPAARVPALRKPEPWMGRQKRRLRFGRLDRLAQLVLVAGNEAIQRWGQLPAAPERAGVAIGTAYGSHLTNELFFRDVLRSGAGAASPSLFAYTLPSSASGELSIHFGLEGPALTLAHGTGAGLSALGVASRAIGSGDADVMLAGGADALGATLLRASGGASPPLSEGAALFLLSADPTAALAAVGGQADRYGAGALDRAAAAALEEADVLPSDLALCVACHGSACGELGAVIGRCSAAAPALAALLAALRGQLPALVTVEEAGAASALCLVRLVPAAARP